MKSTDKNTDELIERLSKAHEELKQEKALRQYADKSLEIYQKKLQSVLDTAGDAIITIDGNHEIIYWNRAAEYIFGYSAQEAVSNDITIIIPEKFRQKHKEGVKRVSQTGKSNLIGKTFELEALKKDGKEFPVEISLALWQAKGDSFYTGIIRDISRRKQTEAELHKAKESAEAANKAKSVFLANMSHELRTPLNGIIGMTNLALDTLVDTQQREYLTIVKNSAAHLLDLLNGILDFSKIEAGKMEIKEADFNLISTIKTTTEPLIITAANKGVMFSTEISPNVPAALRGDSGLLKQVLVNLIGNAIKFTEKGKIELKADMAHHITKTEPPFVNQPYLLHFSVSDTGIGIPGEKLGIIFDSFTMLEEFATKKYEGTGLGLAIVKKIVAMLGGEVWVESKPGKGSTFHFTAGFSASSGPVLSASSTEKIDVTGKRILLVDSNASTCRRLADILRGEGFYVDTASGGYEASGMLTWSTVQYNIVIVDFQLTDMDGFAFSRNMKSMERLSQVKVIMLISSGLNVDEAQCRELGISGFLVKPIYKSDLMEVLSILTENWDNPIALLLNRHRVLESRRALRVLIADDDVVNQTLTVKLLQRRGIFPDVAGTGREAIDKLSENYFDLIIMDVQMPVMDGLEATRHIRGAKECEINKDVPVIIMTAHALKGDREHCLEAGASDYISKPVDADELYNMIDKHTASRHVAAETPFIRQHSGTDYLSRSQPAVLHQPAQRTSGMSLNVKKVLQRVQNDERVLRDMWQAFTEDAPGRIALLKSLFEARNLEGLKSHIHLIIGMSANVGATGLRSEAFRMELALKELKGSFQNEEAKILNFIENIQFESEKVIKEITTLLLKPQGEIR